MAEALLLPGHSGAALTWSQWRRHATVQGPESELREWVQQAGLPWPEMLRAGVSEAHALLRLAPTELALLGCDARSVVPTRRMVLNGAGFQSLEMVGPECEDWLAAGVPIDLAMRAFPVGMATRTVLGKVEINLWRVEETRFRIECARSFFPYLLAFLAEAVD